MKLGTFPAILVTYTASALLHVSKMMIFMMMMMMMMSCVLLIHRLYLRHVFLYTAPIHSKNMFYHT